MSSTNQFPQGDPLLPTPRALDASGVRGRTPNRTDEANARAGLSLTDVLVPHDEPLLPSPTAHDVLDMED
jgi:hypothetical protein